MGSESSKTIRDFGEQWTRHQDNDGYYGSVDLFRDYLGSLLSLGELKNAKIADIGSGSGRIVQMLLNVGAEHVTAVEPSDAFFVMQKNLLAQAEKVSFVHGLGEALPPTGDYDFVFSLGVIHHIAEPDPVMRAILHALKPGGKAVIWLYGFEGNQSYLAFARSLRLVTTLIPNGLLDWVSFLLAGLASAYGYFARYLKKTIGLRLPLQRYLDEVFLKLDAKKRKLIVFDQLNPAFAKYYRKSEAVDLFHRNGFKNIRIWHRHGYSWTVIGEK